jgi:hypothetical protein
VPTEGLHFFSDGLKLAGDLTLPENAPENVPAVIVCSGLHGLKDWVPGRWRPHVLTGGFAHFAFDYRGFGGSEGERGRMLPEEEVRDVLNALIYLRTRPEVDPNRIALIGWGLGGGVAISAAAADRCVAAVICANGSGDYGRATRDAVAYPNWLHWVERLAEDRVRRVTTGRSEMVDYRNITNPASPEGYIVHDQFYKDLASIAQQPTEKFSLETCEAYINFRPEKKLGAIAPRPILFLHGEKNHFMPVDEARRMHALAGGSSELRIVNGAKHLEMIDPDYPGTADTMRDGVCWLDGAINLRL